MHAKTEKIKLSDTGNAHIPLGFKKIHLEKIPALELQDRLTLYNKKYRYNTMQASLSDKPISKILK